MMPVPVEDKPWYTMIVISDPDTPVVIPPIIPESNERRNVE